jgi:hypothetical protein
MEFIGNAHPSPEQFSIRVCIDSWVSMLISCYHMYAVATFLYTGSITSLYFHIPFVIQIPQLTTLLFSVHFRTGGDSQIL